MHCTVSRCAVCAAVAGERAARCAAKACRCVASCRRMLVPSHGGAIDASSVFGVRRVPWPALPVSASRAAGQSQRQSQGWRQWQVGGWQCCGWSRKGEAASTAAVGGLECVRPLPCEPDHAACSAVRARRLSAPALGRRLLSRQRTHELTIVVCDADASRDDYAPRHSNEPSDQHRRDDATTALDRRCSRVTAEPSAASARHSLRPCTCHRLVRCSYPQLLPASHVESQFRMRMLCPAADATTRAACICLALHCTAAVPLRSLSVLCLLLLCCLVWSVDASAGVDPHLCL